MNFLRNAGQKLAQNSWFLVGVILPVLLSAVYYYGIASDQYVSESRFVIKAPNQRAAQTTSFANLIQSTGLSSGQEQSNQVIDFVRSRSALETLDKKLDIKKAYGDPGIDLLSRFPRIWEKNAFEDLFDYYRTKIEISRDNDTGLVVLRTIAFSPKDAAAINAHLLQQSETLVNQLNENARNKAISEAENRVVEAQTRVNKALKAVSDYRSQARLVEPLKEATGVVEIANRLITERAALEAQLSTVRQVTPDHPSIPVLREQIASLTREIERQNSRLVGGGTNTISRKLPDYEALQIEQELASQLLVLSQTSLEQARTEALKQQFYLERVVEPNVPDLPEYPKALKTVLTILGFALCLYFIIWMFVVGILEHAPED
ncbi:capsule biosynthesis protein [Erythrobacter sp. WG]|uniref:capsule biosynthesis protein n=1 Tax=Erythrobacter sp. WG TaxID=2985510 RepID=UPI00226E2DF8|nr:capsule biosynthesis protein [Erythrobacter sp. WG]MCX9145746.1 capsule biosynthesis protein [Erythrobacter sp. WG]